MFFRGESFFLKELREATLKMEEFLTLKVTAFALTSDVNSALIKRLDYSTSFDSVSLFFDSASVV